MDLNENESDFDFAFRATAFANESGCLIAFE